MPSCKQLIKISPVPLFLLFFLLLNTTPSFAITKTLMITPVRAIFLERQRTVSLSVGNPGNFPISYSVSLVTMRRNQKGKLYEVEQTAETAAETLSRSLIRFSPRRATIKPHARQVVKLMVRKPKSLPLGEYQTRLKISPMPSSKEETAARRSAAMQEEGQHLAMDLLVGISIPVIVQHGKTETTISPISLSFKRFKQAKSGIAAELFLTRDGNYSGFGNINLTYTAANGEQKKIGNARGIAIYQPAKEKLVTVPLHDITADELHSGSVRADFLIYRGKTKKRRNKPQIVFKDFALH